MGTRAQAAKNKHILAMKTFKPRFFRRMDNKNVVFEGQAYSQEGLSEEQIIVAMQLGRTVFPLFEKTKTSLLESVTVGGKKNCRFR